LIDLAPTILQLLGEPIPEDMDGRVLSELLAETRAPEFAAVAAFDRAAPDGYSEEEAKAIEERLAGLGYLG
jgi:arylsulfatase A-like enzyme